MSKSVKMKKLILIFLCIALAAACAGCGGAGPQAAPSTSPAQETAAQTPAVPGPTTEPEPAAEGESGSDVLVVYFSATGTTRGVAEKIAALTGGELVELVPAQPYTAEDLNYHDRSTRATVEQNTPDARPEIANDISLEGCRTLYLGYPIWWGQAPRIMSSFVESHDLSGVTVIPFCTSGGSGAGRTGETLGEQAGTGSFLPARRLDAGVSDDQLQAWLDGIG